MTEIIASAVVELARYAVIAYAIRNGRDVLVHWLDRMSVRHPEQHILDTARTEGIDLHALADRGNA